MTWFKVDDAFAFHPKAIAAGNSALGLWVRAGAWCSANLTDGALPRHMIGTLGAQKRNADRLVAVGLWRETPEGYQFTDWDQWQPSKEQVKAEREATKARQKAWRERKRNAVTNDVTNGVTNAAPTRPDPTRTSSNEEVVPAAKPLRVVASDMNAGQIVGLWIESLNRRPPGSVVGQVSKQVKQLLDEKFTSQEILDGLKVWQAKGLHPSTLPSVVNETINKPKRPTYTDEVIQPRSAFSAVVDR